MLRLNEVIEKSKQLTSDNFSLFVDGILRIQECDRCEFNEYMLKYKANNITDIAESIYYNTVYIFTDIKNLDVDEYVNEVCTMNKPVCTNEEMIFNVCKVLELGVISNKILDYNNSPIGYYCIKENKIYFYNNDNELITIIGYCKSQEIKLIQISSALTNLYNLENGSIS